MQKVKIANFKMPPVIKSAPQQQYDIFILFPVIFITRRTYSLSAPLIIIWILKRKKKQFPAS
jgi:hypothetical protein